MTSREVKVPSARESSEVAFKADHRVAMPVRTYKNVDASRHRAKPDYAQVAVQTDPMSVGVMVVSTD
jgi:hypothetical protein